MSCASPRYLSSPRRVFVPCGECNFCLQRKRADWTFRLRQEEKVSVSSKFLTLTYNDETLPRVAIGDSDVDFLYNLRKRDLQLFIKRLRKANEGFSDYGVRYYAVGEYGTRTLRPHYHVIVFNVYPRIWNALESLWGLGHVHAGECSVASIHYVTKYVINKAGIDHGGREPPFAVMSSRPGIGYGYLQTHLDWHRSGMRNYTEVNGQKGAIPRYYKDRIFTTKEKELLSQEAVALSDVAYIEAVIHNADFHADPYFYYDEALRQAHEAVTSKINDHNTF